MSVRFQAAKRLGPFSYEAAFEADQEIVVLFGHSGAGKSVTLQIIAGLLKPDSGQVVIDGAVHFDSAEGVDTPPQERGVGYVVQELALFPHLTVAQNVAFGMPKGIDRTKRTGELLTMLGLEGFGKRKPGTLSGGQRQRVALARALGREARVLLLDEPFSALDDSLRAGLRRELLRLRSELGLTIVFVTHDLREAHLLADKLAVFDEGRLLQIGPREEVFRRPATKRVAELTNVSNIWPATVLSCEEGGLRVVAGGLALRCVVPDPSRFAPGQEVHVVIRSERVNLRRDINAEARGRNWVVATLVDEAAYGNAHVLRFRPDEPGPEIEVEIGSRPYEVLGLAERHRFALELPPEDLHVIPAGV